MSWKHWTGVALVRRAVRIHSTPLTTIAVAAATALASACSAERPVPLAGPDPSDPRARTPAASYRSTVAPYESLRPVEPAPWHEQNRQVTPQPKR